MVPTTTKQAVIANFPSPSVIIEGDNQTFRIISTELPPLKEDQVLLKTIYISNDPFQREWLKDGADPNRSYLEPPKIGSVMFALGIAEVVESTSSQIPKGAKIYTRLNWSEYTVAKAKNLQVLNELPNGLSWSHYLGALGGPGLTAWFGLKEVVNLKPSDTIVVSGAAGATGSMVVQLAKRVFGCKRVVGIAGGEKKCEWVKSIGADACVDYKAANFKEKLIEATEEFADVYFDNVGGEILNLMLGRIARFGRIAACGAIAIYNTDSKTAGDKESYDNWFQVIAMQIAIKGFSVIDFYPKKEEALEGMRQAILEGKLDISAENETVVDTKFEDVPKTWVMLFSGGNTGKLITRLV